MRFILNKTLNIIIVGWPIQLINILTGLLPNSKVTCSIRGFLMKPFFKKVGKNFQIGSNVIINQTKKISIGNNVYIAHNNWINGSGGLEIKNNVMIGPSCVITTTKHIKRNKSIRFGGHSFGKVLINEEVWIGGNTSILPNVEIGRNTIIGAGSVVTKSIRKNSIACGNPAKIIKENDE